MFHKWVIAGLISANGVLHAVPISIFNTGVCGGNNPTSGPSCSGGLLLASNGMIGPQFDNNYKLIASPIRTGTNSSQTTINFSGVPPNTTSVWITPAPGGPVGPGLYVYQTSFSLAGFIPSTFVLNLSVAANEHLSVRINGGTVDVFTYSPISFDGPCALQFCSTTINNAAVIAANGAGWNAGTNTIEFLATELGVVSGFATLRVEVSGDASQNPPAVPLPPTLALVCVGLTGMLSWILLRPRGQA